MKETLTHFLSKGVSEWFDQDGHRVFVQTVRSGDILELRSTKCSHWGIAYRVKQPPSPSRNKNKPGGYTRPILFIVLNCIFTIIIIIKSK